MKRLLQTVLAAGLTACLAGCATGPRRAAPLAPYRPDTEGGLDLRVAPAFAETPGLMGAEEPATRLLLAGDRLLVTLRMFPKTETFECVIDENGTINLDLVGRVQVGGMTATEGEKAIERAYIEGEYFKNITATIIPPVREFYVKGSVYRQGNFPMSRARITVLQALSMAGGWTEFADPAKVRLIRGEEVMILNIPRIAARQEQDVIIEPGDVLDVPKRWL